MALSGLIHKADDALVCEVTSNLVTCIRIILALAAVPANKSASTSCRVGWAAHHVCFIFTKESFGRLTG